jgi:hypothetical protein
MNASFRSAIGSPWTEMEPVRVGRVPPGKGTPDVFVIAEENDKPVLRFDVYDVAPKRSAFKECIAWKHWIVIGIGHHLYLDVMSVPQARQGWRAHAEAVPHRNFVNHC